MNIKHGPKIPGQVNALDFAQRGDKHDAAKSLKGFGGAGGTYRAVYTMKFAEALAKELRDSKAHH
jgi:hypothetical protein